MRRTKMRQGGLIAGLVLLLHAPALFATVKPHALISDGMVLQQGMPVPIWGTADDGEKVTVRFQGQEVRATASKGQWLVHLESLKAGGPFEPAPSTMNDGYAVHFRPSNVPRQMFWSALVHAK